MAMQDFRPGVYRHYKGDHYLALGLARADETDEVVVVYTRLYARRPADEHAPAAHLERDRGHRRRPAAALCLRGPRHAGARLTRRRAAPGVIHFTSISAAPSPTWSPTA